MNVDYEAILRGWDNYRFARIVNELDAPEEEATHAIGVVIIPKGNGTEEKAR